MDEIEFIKKVKSEFQKMKTEIETLTELIEILEEKVDAKTTPEGDDWFSSKK